ncbi:MAG: triose-phosphate isomerase [Rhodospirillales bacterium]|nr:triose-phosphate isomerase [Alphaproteobacteria bacterium]MCB1840486.1 triose-phosphate isomerase [Alphaproteobacteria bacterium]MCB9977416.1 triose-phosphate isomerase [Rhodospirillales bacterium]
MKKLIAGNWKMNLNAQKASALALDILKGLDDELPLSKVCDFVVFPPCVHLPPINQVIKSSEMKMALGAQDCSQHETDGAHTGEISAAMLADYGCTYVIVGHSERRQGHGETDAIVKAKAAAAHNAGLTAVICIGETDQEREQGQERDIVSRQLLASLPESSNAVNTVIAYEPVWAIGTGKTAKAEDVAAMHALIREKLSGRSGSSQTPRILYGGSMKPENAAELLATPNVDGGLIGGASLKAEQFLAIGRAVRDS